LPPPPTVLQYYVSAAGVFSIGVAISASNITHVISVASPHGIDPAVTYSITSIGSGLTGLSIVGSTGAISGTLTPASDGTAPSNTISSVLVVVQATNAGGFVAHAFSIPLTTIGVNYPTVATISIGDSSDVSSVANV